MGSGMLGLNKEGGTTMKKMTKQEKNEVKAGWVCVLWGAVCWG
ncbi:hypothetical protein RV06_GL002298 [Enterococcus haemoperoxidus]|nr:hypothetical protein RV06_GL002298 [Enterococcus haemoperoxidus]